MAGRQLLVAAVALCLLVCAAAQSSPVYAEGLTVGKIQLNVNVQLAAAPVDPPLPPGDSTVLSASTFIFVCGTVGIIFAIFLFLQVRAISLNTQSESLQPLMVVSTSASDEELITIYETIKAGARAFLWAEYQICFVFVAVFAVVILVLVSHGGSEVTSSWDFNTGFLTALSFVIGALTSILAGYIGMMVAVFSNARTTVSAKKEGEEGWRSAFNCAFRAGGVMGYSLCALSLMILYLLCLMYRSMMQTDGEIDFKRLFECVAGYGLFGSFGEASCAAMLIGSASQSLQDAGWVALVFPLFISAVGIIVCMCVSFVATDLQPVRCEADIEKALKMQLLLTSIAMTAALFPVANWALPLEINVPMDGVDTMITPLVCYLCTVAGLWGGCLIGFITEYYTSHSYTPVREVARATETGAATNIIYGLALGYQSAIAPVCILSFIIFLALKTAGMYGVALAALGMLSTLSTCLAIDVYGPISDNAGGIAEMVELPSSVRDKTDALDAAGNTTAAIGKGFAIGSAALVSLALFGAFVTRASKSMTEKMDEKGVNLLSP